MSCRLRLQLYNLKNEVNDGAGKNCDGSNGGFSAVDLQQMSLSEEQIIQTILSSNQYIGNNKVVDLKELLRTVYSSQTVEQLIAVLQKGEYEKPGRFIPPVDLLGQELTVIRFRNERDKTYYGICYGAFEPGQKPEMVAIYTAV